MRAVRTVQVDDLTDVVLLYEELARKLGLVTPVVVGQSFGGMLACELAAHFPDLPSALVVLGSGPWLWRRWGSRLLARRRVVLLRGQRNDGAQQQ